MAASERSLKLRVQRILDGGHLGHIEAQIGPIRGFQVDPKRDLVHYFGKKRNATEPLLRSLEHYEAANGTAGEGDYYGNDDEG